MKKTIFVAFLCGIAAFAQQNTVMKPVVSATLSAAPVGDCRQQYYNQAVDPSQNIWNCNPSNGTWEQSSFGSGVATGTGSAVLQTSPTILTPNITLPVIEDSTDTTKALRFSLSGDTTATATTFSFAQTAARTVTFPDASITIPGTILTDCGSSASCATPTTRSSTMKVVTGTIAFSSSTTAAVSGISPAFTSATSYSCSAYDGSHAYTWLFTTQSGTGFTITAGTSNSDVWAYSCVGY